MGFAACLFFIGAGVPHPQIFSTPRTELPKRNTTTSSFDSIPSCINGMTRDDDKRLEDDYEAHFLPNIIIIIII